MTPNLTAFLALVRRCEVGTTDASGYKKIVGGGTFGSWNDHPRIAVQTAWGWSSAAGGYQAMAAVPGKVQTDTWGDFIRSQGPHDFTPESQDLFARWCIERRHATADVEAGRIADAIAKCNKEWASLPGSPYGQPTRDLNWCLSFYQSQGGTLVQNSGLFTLREQPPIVDKPTQKAMDPLTAISIFGPLVSNLIPQVSKIFGGGERAQQNVQAAQVVLDTVVKAAGAVNEQDAVQRMQSDPAVLEKVTQAVVTEPSILAILEVGGGIQEARKADVIVTQGEHSFLRSPAFWISVVLLIMPFMLLADAFYIHPASYEKELRTQIVTGVLAVIMVVGGYFLGSSAGSAKKDDTINKVVG